MDKESLKIKLHLLEQSDSLHSDREKKYHEMEKVVRNINQQTLLHHKGGKRNNSLLVEIHEQRQRLFQLKEEIKQIDHTLDLLKEDELSHHDEILDQLVEQTLIHFPESNLEYNQLKELYYQKQKERKLFEEIEPYLTKYYQHFQKAASLLIQSNKRSLFAILFGRHPKVLLAYEIHSLAKEAQNDLKNLQSSQLNCSSVKERLILLLKEWVLESDKKWNKALYEKSFLAFFKKVKELHDEIEELKRKHLNFTKEYHNKIKNWMKQWLV